MALPFDRFLSLIYFFATENADEKAQTKFDMKLNLPPAGLKNSLAASTGRFSPEAEKNALSGLAAMVGGLK